MQPSFAEHLLGVNQYQKAKSLLCEIIATKRFAERSIGKRGTHRKASSADDESPERSEGFCAITAKDMQEKGEQPF